VLGVLAIAPSVAIADEPPEKAPAVTTGVQVGERLTMPAKRLFLHANIEMEMSKGAAGKAISLSPDVFYGVNEKLTVGLVHSFQATTGFMGGSGSSLCLIGDLCGDVYNGFGLDARYQLKSGKVSIAGNAGIQALNIDPFQLLLKLGVVGRWRPSPTSKLAVDFQPAVFFGITEREPAVPMMGVVVQTNKEIVAVPATLLYAIKPNISLALQTGVILPLDDPGARFLIPASLGASYWVNNQITIDAAFTLFALAGGSDIGNTGVDGRTLTIGGGYAF
jgi:hypothetical protein